MKTIKFDNWCYVPNNYTGIAEYPSGTLEYFLNGGTHKEDGPAVIWYDGTIQYFVNNNNITIEVNEWLNGGTDMPPPYEKWDNNTRLLFKLTFG